MPIKCLETEIQSSALKAGPSVGKPECTVRSSISTVSGSIPSSSGELIVGAGTLYAHRVNVGSCEEFTSAQPLSKTAAEQLILHSNVHHYHHSHFPHQPSPTCLDRGADRNANTIFQRQGSFATTGSICRNSDALDTRKLGLLDSSASDSTTTTTTASSSSSSDRTTSYDDTRSSRDRDGASSVEEETVILKV